MVFETRDASLDRCEKRTFSVCGFGEARAGKDSYNHIQPALLSAREPLTGSETSSPGKVRQMRRMLTKTSSLGS